MENKDLQPIHILALHVLGWALLAVLSFLFHAVGFVIVLILFAIKLSEFAFVYQHTKDFPYDTDTPTQYEQLSLFDDSDRGDADSTTMGKYREGRLRENLSESKE